MSMIYGTEQDDIIAAMRAAGRTELVHFAGAAHRDRAAAQLCREWQRSPSADEDTLRQAARRSRGL